MNVGWHKAQKSGDTWPEYLLLPCPALWWKRVLPRYACEELVLALAVGGAPTSQTPPGQCHWEQKEMTKNNTVKILTNKIKHFVFFFNHEFDSLPCWKVESCAEAAKYLDLEKQRWRYMSTTNKIPVVQLLKTTLYIDELNEGHLEKTNKHWHFMVCFATAHLWWWCTCPIQMFANY